MGLENSFNRVSSVPKNPDKAPVQETVQSVPPAANENVPQVSVAPERRFEGSTNPNAEMFNDITALFAIPGAQDENGRPVSFDGATKIAILRDLGASTETTYKGQPLPAIPESLSARIDEIKKHYKPEDLALVTKLMGADTVGKPLSEVAGGHSGIGPSELKQN